MIFKYAALTVFNSEQTVGQHAYAAISAHNHAFRPANGIFFFHRLILHPLKNQGSKILASLI